MLKWFLYLVHYFGIIGLIVIALTRAELKYGHFMLALIVILDAIITYLWVRDDLFT